VEGAEIRGFVPDLYLRMAAADVAVVQGGLTTTMELTAARVPFVYVPLEHHFEQNFHVRHRLERYRAGQCASYAEISDPEWLAETLLKLIDTDVSYRPVESGGAEQAAAMLAELI
jgi:UDP-N-acetylglucosamine:LPS N-acetylglucosamine transferase